MYTPGHFAENDPDRLHTTIGSNPLATLIVSGPSGPEVNHIPFVLDVEGARAVRLRGHIPKANPLREMGDEPRSSVAVFHGPQGYISPAWYATKPHHGKVVPTWNYSVVHVHGTLRIIDDRDWLMRQIDDLTRHNESGRAKPWTVTDAPGDFIARLARSLSGIELSVTRIEGKTKASQNQPTENQASVLAALEAEAPGSALWRMMREALKVDS